MSVPALNSQNTPGSLGAPLRPGSLRAWRVLTRENSLLPRWLFFASRFAVMPIVPDLVASANAVVGYLRLPSALAPGRVAIAGQLRRLARRRASPRYRGSSVARGDFLPARSQRHRSQLLRRLDRR